MLGARGRIHKDSTLFLYLRVSQLTWTVHTLSVSPAGILWLMNGVYLIIRTSSFRSNCHVHLQVSHRWVVSVMSSKAFDPALHYDIGLCIQTQPTFMKRLTSFATGGKPVYVRRAFSSRPPELTTVMMYMRYIFHLGQVFFVDHWFTTLRCSIAPAWKISRLSSIPVSAIQCHPSIGSDDLTIHPQYCNTALS